MLLFEDLAGSEFVKLRSQKDLKFKALNNEERDIGVNQTENIGGDETINVGAKVEKVPTSGTGGGNWTLNAAQTVTINIGPPHMPMPLTQLVMDQQSITLNVGVGGMMSQIIMNQTGITLNVGPDGMLAQIVMGPEGVTISGTPVSQLMVQPQGISTMTPMITFTAMAGVTFATPMVTIPLLTLGAGTIGGIRRSFEGAEMPSRVRFSAARGVFDAFPDLRRLAPPPQDDCAPLDYARGLLASAHANQAVAFLAYLLPRREAVWWARQCVGALLGPRAEDAALRVAELWVRDPDEDNRSAALEIGNSGDPSAATTWLARAAAWSGGSMCPPEVKPLPAPPAACAQAVDAAIVMAVCAGEPIDVMKRMAACAEAGIRFAEGGEARVSLPEAFASSALT